jgi:hypothetical protein
MTVRFTPVPFEPTPGQWWYHHTSRLTGEVRFKGPFDSPSQALAEIAMDEQQAEHAMPIPGPGSTEHEPNRQAQCTAADEIDMLAEPYHPDDSTYYVRFWAEIDGYQSGSSTTRIKVSHGELQALRSILALRPR